MSTFARRQGEATGDGTVRGADGAEHLLSPVAMAVWTAADGQSGIEALVGAGRAAAVANGETPESVDRARVFAVLDDLTAVGLLAARVAPPIATTLGRRSLFKSLAAGAAAAAVLAPAVASAADATCQDADAFRKQEEDEKIAEKKIGKQEEKAKQEVQQSEASMKKLGGKQEKDLKKQEAQHEEQRKALKKKVGDGAPDEAKEKEASLAKKQEEEVKKLGSEQAEEQKKGYAVQEEAQKSAEALDGAGCCKEMRAKQAEQWHKGRTAYGTGPSLVFVDLPGGLTIEARTALETIAAGPDGCSLEMDLLLDGLDGGKDPGTLAKTLLAYGEKGEPVGLQWGAKGEFAATGTFTWTAGEWTGTGITTLKPTSARVRVRLATKGAL